VSGQHRFRVVDLFCGAGGLSEGFRQAGYSVVAGSDHDPDACATFALNFPEAETICGDIRTPSVRKKVIAAATGAEVVVGGPPCQAFSQVRNHCRLIDDQRNSLYREFVRIVAKLEPLAFVMENVPGLDQMGVREQVLEDLALKGRYRVTAQVLDAAEFGVPQSRKRIVFIGMHADTELEPPRLSGSGVTAAFGLERHLRGESIRYEVVARDSLFHDLAELEDPKNSKLVTAEQAIGDLAFLKAGERREEVSVDELLPAASEYQRRMRAGLGSTISNVSVPRINDDTRMRLAALPPGGNVHDLSDKMMERYLTGELWGPSNGTGRLGRRHFYAYRRLHPGIWSWTLNTKGDSVYHYKQLRALSVREFARLQSFPDRFVFATDSRRGVLAGRIDGGSVHSRYRQAGNAVPPLLARAIGRSVYGVLTSQVRARKAA
jgi:DNA (cytosine-5)-methyltransferase 1